MPRIQIYAAYTNAYCAYKHMLPYKCMLRIQAHAAIQTHAAHTNAYCAYKCILRIQMHTAHTNACCTYKRILHMQTHTAHANAYCTCMALFYIIFIMLRSNKIGVCRLERHNKKMYTVFITIQKHQEDSYFAESSYI
jgi:hypothetical protein